MKHKVKDKLDKLTLQVESVSATEMLDEFKQELFRQFKERIDECEDWQDDEMIDELSNRLRVIADKVVWEEVDVIDIALICAIVWNSK